MGVTTRPLLLVTVLAIGLAGCHPECSSKQDVAVAFSLSPSLEDLHGNALFDGTVTVEDVTQRGRQWDLDLSGTNYDGEALSMTLTFTTTPEVEVILEEGERVRFQYIQDEPLAEWVNVFAAIWRERDIVLALVDQAIEVKGSLRIDPLSLKVKHGFCPKKSNRCGARERVGVRFTSPQGPSVLVMDHGVETLLADPTYRILVEDAHINYDSLFVPCPGRSRGWLRAAVVNRSR
jgi:hypothetical protein